MAKENSRSKKGFSNKSRRPRKRFLEVDVWQARFGVVSVKAIYDVFSQKFNIPLAEVKAIDPVTRKAKYSFSYCVDALRRLENPDYVSPHEE